MSLSDTLKQCLKQWTLAMGGDELDERLRSGRTANEYGVDAFGFSFDYALSAVGRASPSGACRDSRWEAS